MAMLACLAATGPLALLLSAPVWMFKLGRKFVFALMLLGTPMVVAAIGTGWLDGVLARSSEMSHKDLSAYERIVVPFNSIANQLQDPEILTGAGPGTSSRRLNVVQWPFSKLFYQYGLLTAVLFHLFLLTCVFDGPPTYVLPPIILIPALFFGGGFVSHTNTMPILLFCTLLKLPAGRGTTDAK